MKKLLSLIFMGLLLFSMVLFAADLGSSILTINATVSSKDPSYKMIVSSSELTLDDLTASATTTYDIGSIYAAGTGISQELDSVQEIPFYLGIAQTESRYSTDIRLSLTFSKLTHKKANETGFNAEAIDIPTISTITTRNATLGLTVGDLTRDVSNKGLYTINLDYSILGYFIQANTGLKILKVVYKVPEDFKDSSTEGYMPAGDYTGTITLKVETV